VGLKQGARSNDVKSLQSALMAAGITVRGGADGIFGPATRAAVVAFQKQQGLGQTGAVDSSTASKLSNAGSSSSTGSSAANSYVGLKQGSRGDAVRGLQRALMQSGLGLRGGADGIFGPATKATLIVFQRVNGLSQTGVLGAKGADYLGLGSSSSGIVRTVGFPVFGERGTRVQALQRSLMSAGISVPGGADGAFGGSTAGAVMEFQRRNGLAVTGKVDSATASKLALAAASAPSPPSSTGVDMKVFPVQGKCWFGDTWLAPRGAGRTHQGVDIIAAEGKLLYAVVDGTISKRYFDYPGSRSGNGVRVARPDGTYFTYLHMLELAPGIKVGTKVKAGEVIGYVGNTGNSGTPHLHMEVHPKGGSAINPYPLVKAINACSVTTPR
jgi:peptidoglycan hydrolase-like protein with peptidoglycan-binding domain